ncbi:MAG TPA: alanine racemase [Chromatiaceae bacterium]|nr:alanine racemase [Chromatiaceae bacterium]
MTTGPHVAIDLSALRHNLAVIRARAPASRVMAIIKANGYGHGMLRVARALAEADMLGVARVGEAAALRAEGDMRDIIVLEGAQTLDEVLLAAELGLSLVVHHASQLDLLGDIELARPLACWLKLDTGMHRLGFSPADFDTAWRRLEAASAVREEPGLMTHFCCADTPDSMLTHHQIRQFLELTDTLPGQRSLANSGGILGWPDAHADIVRPGIALYGVSPFEGETGDTHGLRPAMTLKAPLIAINPRRAGDAIGYGGSWHCPQDMPVGVISIGYGDGYPRHLPSGAPVLLNGVEVPLLGRVSMDMISVDLRDVPHAAVGDEAVLWGEGLPVERIAEQADTIAYELLCGVTSRVAVRVIDDEVD